MRIIDIALLHKDLNSNGLPIGGIDIVTDLDGVQRATYFVYFGRYLRLLWNKEPADRFVPKLTNIFASHSGEEVDHSDFIDQRGSYPSVPEATTEASSDEAQYIFQTQLPSSLATHLAYLIECGASLSIHKSAFSDDHTEFVDGADASHMDALTTSIRSLPEIAPWACVDTLVSLRMNTERFETNIIKPAPHFRDVASVKRQCRVLRPNEWNWPIAIG